MTTVLCETLCSRPPLVSSLSHTRANLNLSTLKKFAVFLCNSPFRFRQVAKMEGDGAGATMFSTGMAATVTVMSAFLNTVIENDVVEHVLS